MKTLIRVGAALALLGLSHSALAASVSLSPTTIRVGVGDSFTVQVVYDFSDDPTVGGGFDIKYDPAAFSLTSFSFITGATMSPIFRLPDLSPGSLFSAAYGNFTPITGPLAIAEMTFVLLDGTGDLRIDIGGTVGPGGPFVRASDATAQVPDFFDARVKVVPIPAAVWLFGTALVGLLGMRRR